MVLQPWYSMKRGYYESKALEIYKTFWGKYKEEIISKTADIWPKLEKVIACGNLSCLLSSNAERDQLLKAF